MKCEQCGATVEQQDMIYCDACINIFNADLDIDINNPDPAELEDYQDEMP